MHSSTAAVLRFFEYAHLPEGFTRDTSMKFAELALDMARTLPEDPETTVALRKLLEAKDAAVRSSLLKSLADLEELDI